MNERLIQHKDVQLCTQSFGQVGRPTVLLIMGATASMLWWDTSFCQQLARKGYFVIRYDNRDVGQSTTYTPGPPPYQLDDLVDDAMAIINGYGLGQAHLVGMSLGGLIAQMAALKYPRRVKSLTLISTGPWGDSDPTIPEMDQRIVAFQAKRGEVDWTDEQAVVEYMSQGAHLMSGRKPFDKNRHEQLIRAEFKRATNYVSMFNHAFLQGGEQYYGRVSEIKQPTLLIHGTDDVIWSYKHTDVLLAELDDAHRITLEGTGHELHAADWDKIISGIADHISSVAKP
ncbi:alpha/beta hydrolase [Siphonobacter sp. SORGH_AS_0500]|uniref:macrolide hydrolase EstT n=1 Tax=Siphonobacter sp. SORGH_AS_0500 TaxID=1864824 RepID=UPI000CBE1669|nr:macrolide hydrolase EstT [Siphonobacter sp. SORGH_AS_0500]PKK38509.1 alpha/beta hydrolase [Siphonobacter sp. SORGH_AS_0500]